MNIEYCSSDFLLILPPTTGLCVAGLCVAGWYMEIGQLADIFMMMNTFVRVDTGCEIVRRCCGARWLGFRLELFNSYRDSNGMTTILFVCLSILNFVACGVQHGDTEKCRRKRPLFDFLCCLQLWIPSDDVTFGMFVWNGNRTIVASCSSGLAQSLRSFETCNMVMNNKPLSLTVLPQESTS